MSLSLILCSFCSLRLRVWCPKTIRPYHLVRDMFSERFLTYEMNVIKSNESNVDHSLFNNFAKRTQDEQLGNLIGLFLPWRPINNGYKNNIIIYGKLLQWKVKNKWQMQNAFATEFFINSYPFWRRLWPSSRIRRVKLYGETSEMRKKFKVFDR